MKTLQNNFTTPEQSKRLLAMGVPADSADMIWRSDDNFTSGYYDLSVIHDNRVFSTERRLDDRGEVMKLDTLPCWSVGRLIEILDICQEYCFQFDGDYDKWIPYNHCSTEDLMQIYTDKRNRIDFSKLEDYK